VIRQLARDLGRSHLSPRFEKWLKRLTNSPACQRYCTKADTNCCYPRNAGFIRLRLDARRNISRTRPKRLSRTDIDDVGQENRPVETLINVLRSRGITDGQLLKLIRPICASLLLKMLRNDLSRYGTDDRARD
jgi:hypothetical protein